MKHKILFMIFMKTKETYTFALLQSIPLLRLKPMAVYKPNYSYSLENLSPYFYFIFIRITQLSKSVINGAYFLLISFMIMQMLPSACVQIMCICIGNN